MGSTEQRLEHYPVGRSPMKISILLPTRNRLTYLKLVIETVRRQDSIDWEIVISDNDSTEDIESYVESLGDGRIRYARTPRCSAGNRELECGRTRLFAFGTLRQGRRNGSSQGRRIPSVRYSLCLTAAREIGKLFPRRQVRGSSDRFSAGGRWKGTAGG